MKLVSRLLLALLLFGSLAGAEGQQANSAATDPTASSTNTAVSFGFAATTIFLKNTGATNELYVDFADTTATTSNFKLLAGESITLTVDRNSPGWTGMGIICDGAETTTFRWVAIRNQ